jgi:hypothetical protein
LTALSILHLTKSGKLAICYKLIHLGRGRSTASHMFFLGAGALMGWAKPAEPGTGFPIGVGPTLAHPLVTDPVDPVVGNRRRGDER